VIAFGDLPRKIFLLHLLLEVLKGSSFFFGQIHAMLLHPGRVAEKKRFQFQLADIRAVEELGHLPVRS
jgi:hypothetical protein